MQFDFGFVRPLSLIHQGGAKQVIGYQRVLMALQRLAGDGFHVPIPVFPAEQHGQICRCQHVPRSRLRQVSQRPFRLACLPGRFQFQSEIVLSLVEFRVERQRLPERRDSLFVMALFRQAFSFRHQLSRRGCGLAIG